MKYYETRAAEIFGCEKQDLFLKRRFRPLVEARSALFFYLSTVKGMTLQQIQDYSGFDHTTVLHGIKQVKVWRQTDKTFADKMAKYLGENLSNPDEFKEYMIA